MFGANSQQARIYFILPNRLNTRRVYCDKILQKLYNFLRFRLDQGWNSTSFFTSPSSE